MKKSKLQQIQFAYSSTMIKKVIFTLLSYLLVVSLHAQISISRSDYANPGDFMRYEIDTPAASFITNLALKTGLNKTWDFSSVQHSYVYDSITFSAVPANAPSYSNLLVNSRYGAHYENADNAGVKRILDRPNNNMTGMYIDFLRFPIAYGNTFRDSLKYIKIGTPASFNTPFLGTIGYDSLRAQIFVFDTITCIGSGTLVLPDTSCEVILVKISSLAATNLYGRMPTTGWRSINMFLGLDSTQRTIEYLWLAKNGKSYMARAVLDANGTSVRRFDRFVKQFTYPKIKSISTPSATKGSTTNLQVNCSGSNFTKQPGFSITIRKGNYKLSLNSYTVVNDSVVLTNFTLKQVDSLGAYTIQLLDPIAGLLQLPEAFVVLPFERIPQLQALSVGKGNPNSSFVDTLLASGTHFSTKAATVKIKLLKNGQAISGIKTSEIGVINDSMVQFRLILDSSAEAGHYAIQAYNWIDSLLVLDSAFVVSMPTGIEPENKQDLGLNVYPNPAKDRIQITFTNPGNEVAELRVFSLLGELVWEEKIRKSSYQIPCQSWNKGVYLIQLKTPEGINTKRVWIE